MPIRVELADQHAILRDGLRRILEGNSNFIVVAEAASGAEALELARRHHPDVALIDIGLRDPSGFEVAQKILQHSAGTAVLILSDHKNERYVARALKVGARGYLLKDAIEDEIHGAIQAIYKGESFFSSALGTRPAKDPIF